MEWLLFIDKESMKMSMREVYTKPTKSDNEIFMVITDKLTAMTICNRYNNEIASKPAKLVNQEQKEK